MKSKGGQIFLAAILFKDIFFYVVEKLMLSNHDLVNLSLKGFDVIIVYIFIILHQLVNMSLWTQLYYSIGNGLNELMVV